MGLQSAFFENHELRDERMNQASSPAEAAQFLLSRLERSTDSEALRFERVIAELSTRLNLPADEIDDGIVNGLREIVLYTGSAAAVLAEFSGESPCALKLYKWSLPEVPLSDPDWNLTGNDLWVLKKVSSGAILEHQQLSEFPKEAAWERALLQKTGFKSDLSLPLVVSGKVLGVLGIFVHQAQDSKLRDLIPRIKILVEVFANVLGRKRSEEALHQAIAELKILKNRLGTDNFYLQQEIELQHNFGSFVGKSDALKAVLKRIGQVSSSQSTVMITGETGTGKQLVARAIHEFSPRGRRPLVTVNCTALSPTLIESELFGHEKGSFTGAFIRKVGRFEFADKSTIFLDEIGDLPLDLQPKLLRVLQEGEFERLGSSETKKVDVRIIAATNRDLQSLVAQKKFREDLYYRLNVFPIHCPPLRERREDIPALVTHFVEVYKQRFNKNIESVSGKFMAALTKYDWPGNIRELQNVVERAALVCAGPRLEIDDCLCMQAPASTPPLRSFHEEEREYILKVLYITDWKVSGKEGAAEILQLNRKTLESKMKRLGIRRPKAHSSLLNGGDICRPDR
jgi:transcriptional regulator with GAF, ATPase, and Fis domain